MGDEAGKRVGIRIMEGPKCQVRSSGFLLQTAGSLLPEDWSSGSGSEAGSGGRMEGGGRSIHGEGLASCWGLRAEARVRLYEAVLLTRYLWLLNASTPEKS